jgi:23S rRNA pseudouridine1911/1915/1917 synthase
MVVSDNSSSNHFEQPAGGAPAEDQISVNTDQGDELAGEQLRFCVGSNIKFRRLDKYLCGRFSQFSRSRLQKLIKDQAVNVNGSAAKPSHKLKPGDEIDLILPPREVRELVPEDIPIEVIYEDDSIVVINKQADLIVHPARGYKQGTLVNGLVYHFKHLSKGTDDIRPGIVHRLDRNTTGVMVVAKTDTAHWKISRQFAERKTVKTYFAIVHGIPELRADFIKQRLGVHPTKREKFAIRPDTGKEAITFYEVIEEFRGFSVVKLMPKTGRTHQLRVHMNYIKHPIVADDMYGGKVVYPWQLQDKEPAAEEPLMDRTALHAWKLQIEHPVTKKTMEFEAPLPDDMNCFLQNLRKYRNNSNQ